MTTTEINTAAACFLCLGMSLAEAQKLVLLNSVASNITGGGGGTGGVTSGVTDPVAAPTNASTLYYRTDTGTLWMWNGAAWIALIS